ncbi:MAG TPA: GNAT family N-acetyltransferase [Chitinophagaceae bacterium]|nr:GNAT family N-acetyltransferase [Chitinophagaceae bacterium]
MRYLQHHDIDVAKWDACIHNASNGLIYGYSFYLDHMSRHWDALVLGDYEAVMPLTWDSKYGVRYLYQPPFVASGGIFGNNIDENIVAQFMQAIPSRFRLIDINLNAGNPMPDARLRQNFVLGLHQNYEQIFNGYRQNIKRNIKKAREAGCTVQTGIAVEKIIEIARSQLETVTKVSEQEWKKFERLCDLLLQKKQALTYGILSPSNELLASAVFFFSHRRAYYILVGNHPNGKTLGASHYLIDRFIADHAGNDLILDFEGSDIRSLAFFYSSFGAVTETYPYIMINRLPVLLRWLK